MKLELYHRRDRQNKLEAKLAVAQKIIEEQAECQEMNQILLYELDRRDQAVDEAINLITCLEEQIELLKEENLRLSRVNHNKVVDSESNELASYRQQQASLSPPVSKKTLHPRPLPRVPSFLSENSEGTEALRSLYTRYTIPSESALSKLNEEDDEGAREALDSPRLSSISRLSESSFISIYGDKHAHSDQNQGHDRRKINSSVLSWVEGAPVSSTAVAWTPLSHMTHSLSNAIKSESLSRPDRVSSHSRKNLAASIQTQKRFHSDLSRFEDRHILPPTPDTFCTGKLRADSCNSDYTLNQQERELTSYSSPSEVSLSARPQSACETITSRRAGHGWDRSSETDGGNINRTTEEISIDHSHIGRVKTPVLFTFNESDLDRDISYYDKQSVSHPYLDFTASSGCKDNIQQTLVLKPCIDSQIDKPDFAPKPAEPSNDESIYTSQAIPGRVGYTSNLAGSIPISNPSPVWKRNPISLTLARFRRHDHSSTGPHPANSQLKAANKDANPTLQRDVSPSLRPASAGSRLNFHQNEVKDFTAGQSLERQRQLSACNPSTLPHKEDHPSERHHEEESSGGKSVRKWLGLSAGRSNSIRKN